MWRDGANDNKQRPDNRPGHVGQHDPLPHPGEEGEGEEARDGGVVEEASDGVVVEEARDDGGGSQWWRGYRW